MSEKRVIDFLEDLEIGPRTRENFEKLRVFLNSGLFTGSRFRIIEANVENPSASYTIKHNLGFKPKDAFITFVSNGTASVVHSKTTKENIVLDVSEASKVRLITGSFS